LIDLSNGFFKKNRKTKSLRPTTVLRKEELLLVLSAFSSLKIILGKIGI
jgi:hypothetical protein